MVDPTSLHDTTEPLQLAELTRRLQAHPGNAAGVDKTWVLRTARGVTRLLLEGRAAPVLPGPGQTLRDAEPPSGLRNAARASPSLLPEPFQEQVMDPVVEACHRLETAGVPYLVVGAFGINLRARPHGVVVATLDCDLLLRPSVDDFARALATLRAAGFELAAGGEPLVDENPLVLAAIVRTRSTVQALKLGWPADLLSQAIAMDFDDCWARQTRHPVQGIELRVAPLDAIVASKRAADRPKDRVFLEMWRERLDGWLRDERDRAPPPA